MLRRIGALPNDEKPLFGQALNAAKDRLATAVNERRTVLQASDGHAREAGRDY
jgi:hypothetical protein